MRTAPNVQTGRGANGATANQPARVSRMTLASVKRGKLQVPRKDLLYGPEKIGKSTFAAGAPRPIFLCAEDRTSHLDIARFPEPRAWEDAFDATATLLSDQHDFATFVVDTLDWLEPLCWEYVCRKAGVDSIEKVGGGYGKGYNAALDEWRRFLAHCERLVKQREMRLVVLAHAHIKTWKNPAGSDFDRWTMKLNEKAAGLIREWCDNVLFANYETYTTDGPGGGSAKAKGISTGARVIYTERSAAWEAGNSFRLPATIPLSFEELDAACVARIDPAKIRAEIAELAERLRGAPPEAFDRARFEAALIAAKDDAAALGVIRDRLVAKLSIAATPTSAAHAPTTTTKEGA